MVIIEEIPDFEEMMAAMDAMPKSDHCPVSKYLNI